MKKIYTILFFLIVSVGWSSSLTPPSSFTPYGAGNPPPFSTLPVMSNGASCIGYWSMDSLTGLSSGVSIPTATTCPDLSGFSGPISLNNSGVAANYIANALGNHASVRMAGNSTCEWILPVSAATTMITSNMSWYFITRDVACLQSYGSAPSIIMAWGITGSGGTYGQGVSTGICQPYIRTGSPWTYANTEMFQSDWQLNGFTNAVSITHIFMDNQDQAVTNSYGSTPVTAGGAYFASGITSGQEQGVEIVAILRYSAAVSQAPVSATTGSGVGYDAIKQWAITNYGVDMTPKSRNLVLWADSVFRGYGQNSNGSGNGLSVGNWLANILPKSYAVYNAGWDGVTTAQLLLNMAGPEQIMAAYPLPTDFIVQCGSNDYAAFVAGSTNQASTVVNNIANICQQLKQTGASRVFVTTMPSGGYSGVTQTSYLACNVTIGNFPVSGFCNAVIDLANNAAITLFAAPHFTNAGAYYAGLQCATTILNTSPTSFPAMIGTVTLSSGAAAVTVNAALPSTALFNISNVGPSGTIGAEAATVNSTGLTIINFTSLGTDNSKLLYQRVQ